MLCEQTLDTIRRAQPVALVPPQPVFRISLPTEVGTVFAAAWDSVRGRVVVLDPLNARVIELDTAGRVRHSFGQEGDGPADLRFTPLLRYFATNRLVLIGDTALAIADSRTVKVFDRRGNLRGRWVLDSTASNSPFDMSIALLDDTTLVAPISGRYNGAPDMNSRTLLRFLRLPWARADSTPSTWATLRHSFAALDSFTGTPPQQPYRMGYKRSWGAADGMLTFVSWNQFGVCKIDTDGSVAWAASPKVDRFPVDGDERERVLMEDFNGGTKELPFVGKTGTELYADRWPSVGPVYQDLVVSQGGDFVAWATRRAPHGRFMVDVFRANGYIGSFEPPFDGAVAALAGDIALVVDHDRQEIVAYRNDRRSRVGAVANRGRGTE